MLKAGEKISAENQFSAEQDRIYACLHLIRQLQLYCHHYSLSYDLPLVQFSGSEWLTPLVVASGKIQSSENLRCHFRHEMPEWQALWLKRLRLRSGIYLALTQLCTLEYSVAILCQGMLNMCIGKECVPLLKEFNAAGSKIMESGRKTGLLAASLREYPQEVTNGSPFAVLTRNTEVQTPELFGLSEDEQKAASRELQTATRNSAGIKLLLFIGARLDESLPKVITLSRQGLSAFIRTHRPQAFQGGVGGQIELVLASAKHLRSPAMRAADLLLQTHSTYPYARPFADALRRTMVSPPKSRLEWLRRSLGLADEL